MNVKGEATELGQQPTRKRRRWLRITLRGLLVLFAVLACGLAWLASHIHRARQESQIIAELKAAHGLKMNVSVANPFDDGHPPSFFRFDDGGPQWLKDLLGADICRTTIGITCYTNGSSFGTAVDESGKFYWERNYNGGITTEQLQLVSQLRNLNHLYLEANAVNDEGVMSIVKLPLLQSLNLSHTPITDAGVATLAEAPSLKHLDLSYTDITDRSLDALATFHHLESLNLEATQLSDDRVDWLEGQLPNCEITR